MGRVFDALKQASKQIAGEAQVRGNGRSSHPVTHEQPAFVAPSNAHQNGFKSLQINAGDVEPHLVTVNDPFSPQCERFRSLRTKILEAGERSQKRAFVITSTTVGEGKTLTALNLAWMLAQTDGLKALIIDSDLRKPSVTEYLGIDVPCGLSQVLSGGARLEEAVIRLDPAGLFMLPGGGARADVAELLSGPAYGRILSGARKMFDYIIIDAPPLAMFTDASVLMNRADAALIVIRSRKTRYTLIDRLLEQIPREKLFGVVLNRVNEQFDEATYYYREYYRGRTNLLTTTPEVVANAHQEVSAVN